jgi:hypothetical protein
MTGWVVVVLIPVMVVLWRYGKNKENPRLRKSTKVVFIFAGVGFSTAWLPLATYSIARYAGIHLSTEPLLYLCPTSILSLALDNAPLLFGLLGWLVTGITNAALYAVGGMVIGAVLFPFWKIDRALTDS